jgi:tRNA threonylcarbamoyladenosine biosynthesis protein TsaE
MAGRTVASGSADETFALGERLGRLLAPGDFVGLAGELGAGKTVFSRGVAAGAGCPLSEFSSPTFAIVQTYAGRLLLHHADLYRITSERDLEGTGFFELRDGVGASLVEWIDRLRAAAPPDWLEIRMSAPQEATRALEVWAHGARSEALLEAWLGR